MENEINGYLKHFGKELITKEIEEYATEVALKDSRYMFIERRGKERYSIDPLSLKKVRLGKQQYGYCTYCNKEYETEGLEHNGRIICPGCGSKVKIKSSGISRKYLWDSAYFVHYEKSKIDKNVIVAKGIYTSRTYKGDYKNIKNYYKVEALYIFEIKNPVMLTNDTWGEQKNIKWRKRQRIYSLENIYSGRIYKGTNLESIENAIKDTPYQYSMYEKYKNCGEDSLKYFELFSKYPRVEDLTKLGFEEIIKTKLFNGQTHNAINWRGKTVFKMLKVNKAELKELIAFSGGKDTYFLKLYQLNSNQKNKVSLDDLKEIERQTECNPGPFKEILRYTTFYKASKYIKKQEELYTKKFYRRFTGVVTDWKDYIEDCKKLKMDITKESVLFPSDLYKAHQNTIKQVKYQADKLLDEKMKKREEAINKKYYFEDKDYIIRAVKNTKEIIDEGATLHHCVGGYADKHAKGETNILVIREKKNIDKPYYTIEIKNNKIIQVRGLRNCAPGKKLNRFLDKFKALKIEKSKNKIVA